MQADGPAPIPRDSHVAVAHGGSMFVFGGSTGSAMNDFHELRLEAKCWAPVQASGYAPGHRFLPCCCDTRTRCMCLGAMTVPID